MKMNYYVVTTDWDNGVELKEFVMGKDPKAQGKTPEIAVANLWLQLNSKK